MVNQQAAYALLAEQLAEQGVDVEAVKAALRRQQIETPSWGYANSGTRFKAFAWSGAATTTQQKLDDAAMVHKKCYYLDDQVWKAPGFESIYVWSN